MKKKFDRSKNFYEQYLAGHPITRFLANDIHAYVHLIKIDSATGNIASALKRYSQYNQLLDSNYKVSRIRQVEELQVMYQIDEKENQIALLNQETKLKQASLREAAVLRNVTIAGIIGALIIVALLYRQNRQRKKANNLITHKNAQLQHFLTEKEWLLKEIHHRVKNNLQIVMSLLNTQSAYIDNATALSAINDSQHRVHAMSLIHQKLYDNVSSIDMPSYIRELSSYLAESYNMGQRISFEYNIDPLEMDVSQAVPLGLILNEAITNSIKYAFPGDRNGIISISLKRSAPGRYLLSISDNGIGMPSDVNSKRPGSLGMKLMAGLSEDLDGNFSIENGKGTTIKISFEHDPEIHRPQTSTPSFALSN